MKRNLISALAIWLLASSAANAQTTTLTGTFTGAPFGNTGFVTLTADVNLNNFEFDLQGSGGYAHNWWYSGFSSLTAAVTGSTTPEFNGIFSTDAFGYLRIYSNSETPQQAVMDGNSFADLGANYQVQNAPSDAGVGNLQLGAVSNHPGEYVASQGILGVEAAVPEPAGTLACICTACAVAAIHIRRRGRQRR